MYRRAVNGEESYPNEYQSPRFQGTFADFVRTVGERGAVHGLNSATLKENSDGSHYFVHELMPFTLLENSINYHFANMRNDLSPSG